MDDVDALVEAWVSLAQSQRGHGSDLLADGNRDAIRAAIGNHVLTGTLLVAREDGSESEDDVDPSGGVGFVMFGPDTGQFERSRSRALVRNLWVRSDRRGEGIGSDLLDRAERRLAEEGFDVVALEAMADNEAARRFYRRAGYDTHRVELTKELGQRDGESDTHTN